MNKAIKS